jgi:ABC-type transporter Mla maintaining outer membrane lipid asymmetry ATPase subunit MlaF
MGEQMPIFEEDRLPVRLKLGLVFDGGQLLNHLTVSENIALPVRYHRNLGLADAKEEVQRILELTDLAQWADSTPGAIGRNWQQRVGLARALMLKPEVLLLDNPLAGLDLRHRSWWLKFVTELAAGHDWMGKKPMTLVVTTDDLRPWRKRAGRFAMLRDKRLVVLGSWDQLEKVTDDHLQELLSAAALAG